MNKNCVGYAETKCRMLNELYCGEEGHQCKFFKTPAQAKNDRERCEKMNTKRGIKTPFKSKEY